MAHVLLIDDDTVLSGMLTQYLSGEGFQSVAVVTGEDGLLAAASGGFDAVILDIMLPGLNGIEVLRRLRQVSDVPVIMLSAKGSDNDRVVGLEMGADDYVAKPYYPREMVARLRAVLRRREMKIPGASLCMGRLVLNSSTREALWNENALTLTTSEFNILEALLRTRELVATKDALSELVLGRRRLPYDRSVDVHVSNLRKKIAAICGEELEIETVRGIGYRIRQR